MAGTSKKKRKLVAGTTNSTTVAGQLVKLGRKMLCSAVARQKDNKTMKTINLNSGKNIRNEVGRMLTTDQIDALFESRKDSTTFSPEEKEREQMFTKVVYASLQFQNFCTKTFFQDTFEDLFNCLVTVMYIGYQLGKEDDIKNGKKQSKLNGTEFSGSPMADEKEKHL